MPGKVKRNFGNIWRCLSEESECKILIYRVNILVIMKIFLSGPTSYYIDKKSYGGYSMAYIWNVVAVYFLLYGSVAIDSLFSWFMCNIVAHFQILKYRLCQAGNENDGHCSTQSICDCIAYYCRTLDMAADFNSAFRVIVFIKFAISCMQVCCLAFQLSRDEVLFDQVYHGLFLISVSSQLILYCYGGQRIENEVREIQIEIILSNK